MDPFLQTLLVYAAVLAFFVPLAFWLMPKLDELGGRLSDWMEDRKQRREAAGR